MGSFQGRCNQGYFCGTKQHRPESVCRVVRGMDAQVLSLIKGSAVNKPVVESDLVDVEVKSKRKFCVKCLKSRKNPVHVVGGCPLDVVLQVGAGWSDEVVLGDGASSVVLETGSKAYVVEDLDSDRFLECLKHYFVEGELYNISLNGKEGISPLSVCSKVEVVDRRDGSVSELVVEPSVGLSSERQVFEDMVDVSLGGKAVVVKVGTLEFETDDTLNGFSDDTTAISEVELIRSEMDFVRECFWFGIHEFKEKVLLPDGSSTWEQTHSGLKPVWGDGRFVWDEGSGNSFFEVVFTFPNGDVVRDDGRLL